MFFEIVDIIEEGENATIVADISEDFKHYLIERGLNAILRKAAEEALEDASQEELKGTNPNIVILDEVYDDWTGQDGELTIREQQILEDEWGMQGAVGYEDWIKNNKTNPMPYNEWLDIKKQEFVEYYRAGFVWFVKYGKPTIPTIFTSPDGSDASGQ